MLKRYYFVDLPNNTTYHHKTEVTNNMVIEDLLKAKSKTEDDFLIKVIDTFIDRLTKDYINYTAEDYLRCRKVLFLLHDEFVENNKEFIVDVISYDETKLSSYVSKLSNTNKFGTSFERKEIINLTKKKINGKEIEKREVEYKIQKRPIVSYDILLYGKEFYSQVKQFLKAVYINSKTNSETFKKNVKNNDMLIKIIESKYEEEFGYIKDLDIDIFTKLYNYYKNNLRKILLFIIHEKENLISRQKIITPYYIYQYESKRNYFENEAKEKARGRR